MTHLTSKNLVSFSGFTKDDFLRIFEKSKELKNRRREGFSLDFLQGKTLALLFEKPSLRTRLSFKVAMRQLGGSSEDLLESTLHKEDIQDMSKVLSTYVDGVVIRTFQQKKVEEFAHTATIPIINGLTNELHPCQILADFLTIHENLDTRKGVNITYIGRPNNITNSLMEGCVIMGWNLNICYPEDLPFDLFTFNLYFESTSRLIRNGASKIIVEHDIPKAVKDADIIYTDVWINTGEKVDESNKIEIEKRMKRYQVNKTLWGQSPQTARFMHCLPANRNQEVTSDIIDNNEISLVWQQAANRLHVQRAILLLLMASNLDYRV